MPPPCSALHLASVAGADSCPERLDCVETDTLEQRDIGADLAGETDPGVCERADLDGFDSCPGQGKNVVVPRRQSQRMG